MTSIGYLRALRVRWFPLVAVTLIVTCIAVLVPPAPRSFSEPSTALEDVGSSAHTRYRATAVLGIPPLAGNVETQFRTISFYLRSSKIQAAFAEEIGYTGTNRGLLTRLVTVVAAPAQGTINISGYGGTRQQAAQMSTAFIAALESFLAAQKAEATATALANAQETADGLKAQLEALAAQIQTLRAAAQAAAEANPEADPDAAPASTPEIALLEAQRNALSTSYAAALQTLTKLSNAADDTPEPQLTLLTPPLPAGAVMIPPDLIYRLWIRIALGIALGLLLGAALALVLEHLSRKISHRDVAERAFRSRVLAEVPKRRITGTLKDVAIVSAPTSAAASAYRMLRAVLLADQGAISAGAASARVATVSGSHSGRTPEDARPRSALEPGAHARVLRRAPDQQIEAPRRAVAVEERAHGTFRDDSGDGDPRPTNGSSSHPPLGSPDGRRAEHSELVLATPQEGSVFVLVAPADEPILPVVVANLAASFAEAGSDVIVLRLGEDTGADDISRDVNAAGEHDVWARETAVAGVQTVDWQPGPDTAAVTAVVQALRAEGSVVLIDAGRAATAEFAEVAPIADGVVAVCEFGRTRTDEADRAADIIAWSHGDFRGVVLAQAPSRGHWLRWDRRRSSPLGQYTERGAA